MHVSQQQRLVRIRLAGSTPEAGTRLPARLDVLLRTLRWTAPAAPRGRETGQGF